MQAIKLTDGRTLVFYADSDKQFCPQCGTLAVVPLTKEQLAKQPDNTSHVCHPALGGCNQGFGE